MQLLGNIFFLAFKVFSHCVCKPQYSATTPEDFKLDFKYNIIDAYCIL